MRVPVPFPVRSRARAYGGASEEEIRAAVRGASKRDVPLSMLRTIQRTVDADRLAQYESDPTTRPDGGSPIVIERDGRFYIRNGNHRATAAMRRGERVLPGARVAHIGESGPIKFHEGGSSGDLLMIDPRAMSATYRQHDVEDVASMVGDVAVLCIDGPTESKPDGCWWSYFDDYESILCRFQNAAHSDDVRAILMKIDSPGGAAAGLNECVDAMLRTKKETGKPVYVYADEGAYSAAYAIACVGDEIYVPRAGGVGSIGVISGLFDMTEMNKKDGLRFEVITSGARKADFNPNVPISNAAIARVQKRVDQLAKIYFQLVKDTRGIDGQKLEANTFYGKDAVKKGLADGVMSLESVLASIQSGLDNSSVVRSRSVSNGLSNSVTLRHREEPMSRILALTAKVKAATEALAGASRSGKDAASAALALAESALTKELAKTTKNTKTVKTTDVHESESESSSMSSESSSSSSSSGSESEAAGESESESAESEDTSALASMALKLTGKRTVREAMGALEAMAENAAVAPKMSKRLARLEQSHRSDKVEKLIKAGKDAAKITPGNEQKAREIAAKYGHKALAAFIDAAAPAAAATDHEPAEELGEGLSITTEQRRIWTKMGIPEKDFAKHAKALAKEQSKISAKRGN